MFLNYEHDSRCLKWPVPYSIAKAPAQARGFNNRKFAAPRKNFTDSSMTSAPKRRIYAVGRSERSKKLKLFPLAFFYCTPFLHGTHGASVNFLHGGNVLLTVNFAPQGALLKKASCWCANAFNCNSLLPELRSDRLRCIFILSYKKTLDFFAKCGYNINRGYTKLTVTPVCV